jgi:hypothetical protein
MTEENVNINIFRGVRMRAPRKKVVIYCFEFCSVDAVHITGFTAGEEV